MSDIDVTAAIADRGRDLRVQGQIIPPTGTVVGNVLTATATGSSWQPAAASGLPGSVLFDSTLAAPAAQFDVNPIAATAAHLLILVYGRGTNASNSVNLFCRFNNDSGNNYQRQFLQSQSTTISSTGQDNQSSVFLGDLPAANAVANYAGMAYGFAPQYNGSTFFKTVLGGELLATATGLAGLLNALNASQWRNTAAVTQVTVLLSAGSFATGSRCTILGLGNA